MCSAGQSITIKPVSLRHGAVSRRVSARRDRQCGLWRVLCPALFLLSWLLATPIGAQEAEYGYATYYAKKFEGHRTSSGERLHRDSMTCAHKTHPFGTKLLVTNPRNGKQVIVRVNDRGPYGRGRIIDLSYGAAERLDIIRHGVVKVVVEVWHEGEAPFLPEDDEPPFEYELELLVPERDDDGSWFNESVKVPRTKIPTTSDVVKSNKSSGSRKNNGGRQHK